MTPSTNRPIYAAVITLAPPEAEGKLTVTVRLQAADAIETADGARKPLGECTLAELAAYADELERRLGADYRAATLAALAEKPILKLEVDAPTEDWEHAIVILQPQVAAPAETAKPDTAAPETASPQTAAPETAAPVAADSAPPAESAEPQPSAAGEPEPTPLTVAPPEPVHPEREAAEPPTPTPTHLRVRTAGRVHSPRAHNNLVDILLDDRPLQLMQGHALGSLRREVAGFMLGPLPEKQPGGQYVVHVTDTIIAQFTKMSGASVTYTPESWRYAQDVLADRYPNGDVVMVGWYHTHPGFGIFLSNMDLFIHTNFFTQKWHIAYVLDPVARRSGFFSWDRAHRQVIPYNFPWPEWAADSW